MSAVAVLKLATPPAKAEPAAAKAAALPAPAAVPAPTLEPLATEAATRRGERLRDILRVVIPPLFGIALLLGIWALVAIKSGNIPGPDKTWAAAQVLFADPFYQNGPNDQGIGWNVLSSLQRVGIGFGFAALVGIPMGFLLGRFAFMNRMFEPIISLLRPVSPLAWLPIGLLVFQKADPAATWTIFICSIWPMILNTAQGVQRVPQDYLNVATS